MNKTGIRQRHQRQQQQQQRLPKFIGIAHAGLIPHFPSIEMTTGFIWSHHRITNHFAPCTVAAASAAVNSCSFDASAFFATFARFVVESCKPWIIDATVDVVINHWLIIFGQKHWCIFISVSFFHSLSFALSLYWRVCVHFSPPNHLPEHLVRAHTKCTVMWIVPFLGYCILLPCPQCGWHTWNALTAYSEFWEIEITYTYQNAYTSVCVFCVKAWIYCRFLVNGDIRLCDSN